MCLCVCMCAKVAMFNCVYWERDQSRAPLAPPSLTVSFNFKSLLTYIGTGSCANFYSFFLFYINLKPLQPAPLPSLIFHKLCSVKLYLLQFCLMMAQRYANHAYQKS